MPSDSPAAPDAGHSPRHRLVLAAALGVCLAAAAGGQEPARAGAAAAAQAVPRLKLDADELHVELGPWRTTTRSIRITNAGNADLTVKLQVEGADGGAPLAGGILVLEGGTEVPGYYRQALAGLGLDHVVTADPAEFRHQLGAAGPWALVIVNSFTTTLDGELLDVVADHVDGGGLLIFADSHVYQYPGHRLLPALGVAFVHTIAVPIDFHAVPAGSGLFASPNEVGELRWSLDQEYRDGQLVDALAGSTRLAAFSGYDDLAAIVLGPRRTTLFNGFQAVNYARDDDGDGTPDMVELLANEIAYLWSGPRVTVSPREATVPPSGLLTATVVYDARTACGVGWSGTVRVAGNDPARPEVGLPAAVAVGAAPRLAALPDTLRFRAVMAGLTADTVLVIRNAGCAPLQVEGVACDAPEFGVGVLPGPIPAGGEAVIPLTFAPAEAGPRRAVLALATNADSVRSVVLEGAGTPRPAITAEPAGLAFDLFAGETAAGEVTLVNSSGADVAFTVGRYLGTDADAGKTTALPYADQLRHVLIWEPAIEDLHPYADAALALGITATVVGSTAVLAEQLASGTPWDLVIVSNYGSALSPALLDALSRHYRGDGALIMADALMSARASHRLYADLGIEFVATFYYPPPFSADAVTHRIFHEPNAVSRLTRSADYRYPDGQLVALHGGAVGLAVYDDEPAHPAIVGCPDGRSFFNTFQAVNYYRDGDGDGRPDNVELIENQIMAVAEGAHWLSCTPLSGTIPAGGAQVLAVAVATPYDCVLRQAGLRLFADDPVRPRLDIPVTLQSTLRRRLAVAPERLEMPRTFPGGSSQGTVFVKNTGCEPLFVSAIGSTDRTVTASPGAFPVAGRDSVAVTVVFAPATTGAVEATLAVVSDDPGTPIMTIPVVAPAVAVPEHAVTPKMLAAVLDAGVVAADSLLVANTTDSPLSWRASVRPVGGDEPPDWVSVAGDLVTTQPGTVDVLRVDFAAGDHCGQDLAAEIVVAMVEPRAPGVVVPVSLAVGADPVLGIAPAALDLGTTYLGFPARTELVLRNHGCSSLRILGVESSAAGLSVSLEAADLGPFLAQEVMVTCDRAEPGAFAETLTFTTDSPARPQVVVPVSGVARLAPAASAEPSPLLVTGITVEPGVPVARTLRLVNDGGGDLAWSAAVGPTAAGWLRVSPASGLVAPGGAAALTVELSLPAGCSVDLADSVILAWNDPRRPRLAVPVVVRIGEVSSPVRDLPAGWSLAGLPLQPLPGHASVFDVLERGVGLGVLEVFRDAGDAGYVLMTGDDPLALGAGYWISSRQPVALGMLGTAAAEPIALPLRVGWTLVGHPLPDARPLATLAFRHGGRVWSFADAVAANLVMPGAVGWDPVADTYVYATDLVPWHGYWLAAYAEDVSLVVDPDRAEPASDQAAKAGSGWSVSVDADGSGRPVVLGMHPDGHDGFDARWDLPLAPPGPSGDEGACLVLDREEWRVPGFRTFRTDIRQETDEPSAWRVRLRAAAGEHLLTWDPLALPATRDLSIRRTDTDEVLAESMRAASSCRVSLAGPGLELSFESPECAGRPVGRAEGLNLRTVPNPFNPSTAIHFNLPRAGRGEVRIYDARGALVRRIEARALAAGPGRIRWDGLGGGGAPAPSGVYFYELRLDGARLGSVRKMTLLR